MILLLIFFCFSTIFNVNSFEVKSSNLVDVDSNDPLSNSTFISDLTTASTDFPLFYNSTLIPDLTIQSIDFPSNSTLISDSNTQSTDFSLNSIPTTDLTTQSTDFSLNFTSTTTSTIQTSSIFQQKLEEQKSILLNSSVSNEEMQELFGKGANFRALTQKIYVFFSNVYQHMGQNELRKFFHLKEQQFDFLEMVKEEPENSVEKLDPATLKHFQRKVFCKNYDDPMDNLFTPISPKEFDNAASYFDKKFPGIKPLFQLAYEEKAKEIGRNFNNATIDHMFDGVYFETERDLLHATYKIMGELGSNILKLKPPHPCHKDKKN